MPFKYKKAKRAELDIHLYIAPTHDMNLLRDVGVNDRQQNRKRIIKQLVETGDLLSKKLKKASRLIRKLTHEDNGWQFDTSLRNNYSPYAITLVKNCSEEYAKKQLKKLNIDPDEIGNGLWLSDRVYQKEVWYRGKHRVNSKRKRMKRR